MHARSVIPLALVAAITSMACNFAPSSAGTSGGGNAAGSSPPTGSPTGSGGGGTAGSPITGTCQGLECQQSTCKATNCAQQACPGGAITTLTGKVFDPAGRVPLYNVDVYIPNGPLAD